MGVGLHDIESLIALRQGAYLPLRGRVVEIGAQQLANSAFVPDLIRRFGEAFDCSEGQPSFVPEQAELRNNVELLSSSAPYFRQLWDWIGWSYTAIDVDGSPDSVSLDLNFDAVPEAYRGQYDLVTNYGTTEHIANQLTAFKIIHDLTAVDGVMTHFLPSQGMPNHGIVNYNPKFFWMLCKSNGYEYIGMDLFSAVPNMVYPYPGSWAFNFKWTTPEAVAPNEELPVRDVMVRVSLRKRDKAPFVCPLDLPDDAIVTDPLMRQRYWRYFGDPEPASFPL